MTTTRRVVVAVALLVVLALLATAAVATWTVRRPFPQTNGTLTLDALTGSVDVHRDGFGVPHLYADSTRDLFVAQGFVHAQDRFWEMDVRRHTTAGRLSELFGPDQVETDTFIRTMGWRRTAEAELALLAPETMAVFEAYADGVNAWLADRDSADMALEYSVLGLQRPGYQPEPWTPADSVAWLKAMAWDLRGNIRDELDRVAYSATMPAARVDQLWPPFPFDLRDPIVRSQPRSPVAGNPPDPAVADARGLLAELDARMAALPEMLGPPGTGLGSNSFVVAGTRTRSGLPLLANDPHLGPALPSIWYQMALHCRQVTPDCPYAVTGVSFSGLPGVVIGHNDRIAWGFTNLGPDVTDLVLERVTGDTYQHGTRTLPIDTRTEAVRVAGGPDVTITIRETGHGPLVSDALESFATVGEQAPAAEGRADLAVALRWTALRPGRTADAIPLLNTARTWPEFRAAAAAFEVPSQNLVYADVDGSIGYQAPGRIPIRAPGDDGRWPVPGWTARNDWQGSVAFADLPSIRDPADGYIVTANQPVTAQGAGPILARDFAYGWRSQRLDDLLGSADGVDVDDLLAVQSDARNGLAADLVPLLTATPVPDDVRPARDLLRNWDLQQGVDSAAGAYFAAVWRTLVLRTFGDELPDDADIDGGGRWMEVVRRIVTRPDASWWDDVATPVRETRDDALRSALVAAHGELVDRLGDDPAEWTWGALHQLTLRHQTLGSSGVAPIERLFNRGPVAVGGGSSLVDATGWDASTGYDVNWVPSMRMVVDLSDLDASRWINLTGASGHTFAGTATDQVERWARGDSIPMRWSGAAVRAASAEHLRLLPP